MTKLESLKALWVRTFSPLVSDDGRLGVWLDNCSTPEIIFSMKAAAKRVKKKGVFESPAHAIRYVEKVFRITFSKTLLPYSPPKLPFVLVNGPGEKCWVDKNGVERMTQYWPWNDMKNVGDFFRVVVTPQMRKRKVKLKQKLAQNFSTVHRNPKVLKHCPWLSSASCTYHCDDDGKTVWVLVTRVM